jgi:hypothetical protein
MSPGDTSRLMGAAVLYNPHPTETFFRFQKSPSSKTSWAIKKVERKNPPTVVLVIISLDTFVSGS